MWELQRNDQYIRRSKKCAKRHCRAFAAVHDNLATYHEALNRGALIQDITFGFVHAEPSGIKAIDQRGARHAKELRLYIYPEPLEQIVYLLTIGDKNTQKEDIQFCTEAVKHIRNN